MAPTFKGEEYLEGRMDAIEELKEEIEKLKKNLKECGKYAKIIKIGLDKNDARLLEAEQIERLANVR